VSLRVLIDAANALGLLGFEWPRARGERAARALGRDREGPRNRVAPRGRRSNFPFGAVCHGRPNHAVAWAAEPTACSRRRGRAPPVSNARPDGLPREVAFLSRKSTRSTRLQAAGVPVLASSTDRPWGADATPRRPGRKRGGVHAVEAIAWRSGPRPGVRACRCWGSVRRGRSAPASGGGGS